jgi:peptide/nickel transport system ATP-binding protein
MVFQGAMNSLDPVYTIKQQFVEVLKEHDYAGDSEKLILDSINSVNLDESVLKKYPHELSGGMKQRIIIAMALLLKPKLVIADEPTTALDVLIQAQIINLLKKLKKDGMSIMLITHDLAVLSEIADKVGIMYGGQMIEFGSSQDIYKNPMHPYTKGLLESIPTLHGGKPKYIKGNPPDLLSPKEGCKFIDRCPEAMEKCKKDPPRFKTDSGYVMCWLYEK